MLDVKPQSAYGAARAARPSTSALGAAPARAPLPDVSRPTSRKARRLAARTLDPNSRLSRSEARLLTSAVTCVLVVCGLLVLYLAAYAHVTLLGMDQAQMRTALRQKRLTNEMLRAQLATLRSPDRVAARAEALGLTREARRVDYIKPPRTLAPPGAPEPPPAPDLPARAVASTDFADNSAVTTIAGGEAGPQRTDSGPTSDDNSAAHDH